MSQKVEHPFWIFIFVVFLCGMSFGGCVIALERADYFHAFGFWLMFGYFIWFAIFAKKKFTVKEHG